MGLLVLLLSACSQHTESHASIDNLQYMAPVLMISIDGYRHDYTQKYHPDNLLSFIESGSTLDGLKPVFPSKTFPNHYSIATGMKVGRHGIVSNGFFDLVRDDVYQLILF